MEVKKFEAYIYKGPTLKSINRKDFLREIMDIFTDVKICDYESSGTMYDLDKEELYIFADKKVGDKYVDYTTIKLDFSDMGIEFGSMEWDDEKEEHKEFVSEVNLDTDVTKQVKDFRKNLGKYNV
jgi:hypothetical protein